LDATQHFRVWTGTFQEVLPYLRAAFGAAINAISAAIPNEPRGKLLPIISELCDPDPRNRGDRSAALRGVSPFDLQRYVSRLNLLASEAEFGLLGALSD